MTIIEKIDSLVFGLIEQLPQWNYYCKVYFHVKHFLKPAFQIQNLELEEKWQFRDQILKNQ